MNFVKIEDLREGMRIARPIYSKKGVLLFERNSKLNTQGIENIKNFGLLGLFVLDPAEPAPPMTQADIDFERFQVVQGFAIQDELNFILQKNRTAKIANIVMEITKNYGNQEKKINFVQGLRSKDDYIYRHGLNVAMLSALIGHKYNMRLEDINDTVTASILHDIGRLRAPEEVLNKDERSYEDELMLEQYQQNGFEVIDNIFMATPNIKRICAQTLTILQHFRSGEPLPNMKIVEGAKVMVVAEYFDTMTAMRFGQQPETELNVIKKMQDNPEFFDARVVKALVDSINILSQGVSVVLSTGETALILAENPRNITRPMVLCFKDNTIMDLNDDFTYGDIEVVDIMRTMDNRHVMNTDVLKQQGVDMSGTDEFVPVKGGNE